MTGCPHCLSLTEPELLDDGVRLWRVCVDCRKRWTVAYTDANFTAAIRGGNDNEQRQIRAYLARYPIRRPEPT